VHNGLDHPEIDMLNEQNETTEQESNLFTVMDEHIPSPPEIEAEDVLVLPEIQSMTDYIRLHFEEKLVEEFPSIGSRPDCSSDKQKADGLPSGGS